MPRAIEEPTTDPTESPRANFHGYMRVLYPFQLIKDFSPSTNKLPLDQGDMIMVDSISPSGRAIGTVLDSDSAEYGWVPTDYCEMYDELPMRPLLNALADLRDTIRTGCISSLSDLEDQDFMRSPNAGVRFLLVSPL